MTDAKRILLSSGGTGGHIFPALALAEELARRGPETRLLFMGGAYGPEGRLAAAAGLDFIALPVRGFMGRGARALGAVPGMLRALAEAVRVIREFSPHAAVGFGGYASFAGVSAAALLGIPTAVHEQNALPGVGNRILGRMARRVFLSMPDVTGAFDARKTLLTGNPVRADIAALYERARRKAALPENDAAPCGQARQGMKLSENEAERCGRTRQGAEITENDTVEERPPRLLVMGGSRGARAVNLAVVGAAPALLNAGVEILHQTGNEDFATVSAAYGAWGTEQAKAVPFIDDMGGAYAWADLAFCRAGATTAAELCAAGLPSVLAPFPHAARDHQRFNARVMEEAGAAVILEQERFAARPETPAEILLPLLKDKAKLRAMSAKALDAARPRAAAHMADALAEMIGEGKAAETGSMPADRQRRAQGRTGTDTRNADAGRTAGTG
ncbi:MAG: undecaprenyldiphospho-muramoylpentapeptide beta-N-acetylglucosaminyltransferase [Desulfovibrio sp.]|jgi:UDP-N-acetylglucosamine--N-acetylmuramyl-(pentapeptide) pyrophosphoryl-undecaprenol N-acetylglucosamine transferase|nr:undecaprenyldiphospho-muramoylpentapeptide beta-N-acetylglucosaminyltransferase [Desulfovibrio sp.]